MNRQITRLAFAGLGLIVALVVATTYWQTWAAGDLADRQDKQIERVAIHDQAGRSRRRRAGATREEDRRATLYFRSTPRAD